MKIAQVKKLPILERYLYWIQERESIRSKRANGKPKPWTDDEILQRYRFCNVRRMDDKVSQWLLKNWYEPNYGHPNMLPACAVARLINQPSTLEVIGFPKRWNAERIKKQLRDYRDQGNKVFNSAYIIHGDLGVDKIESVIGMAADKLSPYKIKDVIDTTSMQDSWTWLKSQFGFGSFMAGQVIADLRHAYPGTWADAKTWAPKGPGSHRGMNRLLGYDITTPLGQTEFLLNLNWYRHECFKALPTYLTERLEAIDYQNTLCECDKYERTLFEGRRPKSSYPGV